jgi:putative transposase
METQDFAPSELWARLRFAVVGPLLECPPAVGALQTTLAELAQRHWRHPTQRGKRIRFSQATIERWLYLAKKAPNPMEALMRRVRRDAGVSRICGETLVEYLQQQYLTYPTWSYWLHHGNIVAYVQRKPEIGPAPSYPTLRRLMHAKGWRKVRRRRRQNPTAAQQAAEMRLHTHEVRSYEATASHSIWHLDFHDGSLRIAGKDGTLVTPQCLAILDDHSRLCCHIQWYLNETTEVLVHGVMQAMMKRGLPRCILSDNGAAMVAGEYETGLESLGINYRTILPHSPYQNGKQETFWAVLESRCLAMLERVPSLSLELLNRATQAWVEQDYNRGRHEEIKMAPLEKLLQSPQQGRECPPMAILQQAFCLVAKRTQRRSDGTISIEGVRFELPNTLRTLTKLSLRYRRWDLSEAWVVQPRSSMTVVQRITPLDKAGNADGRRRALEPPTALCGVQAADASKLPPLMTQWLTNYAATGAPPAYLPLHSDTKETAHEPQ